MAELGQVFSPKMAKMPDAPAVVKQPDIEDPTLKDAKRRKVQEEQARGGRDSTMLSGQPSTYASSSLGA